MRTCTRIGGNIEGLKYDPTLRDGKSWSEKYSDIAASLHDLANEISRGGTTLFEPLPQK